MTEPWEDEAMPDMIRFEDNKGRVIMMHKETNMKQIARDGIEIRLVPKDSPLPDGWYKSKDADNADADI